MRISSLPAAGFLAVVSCTVFAGSSAGAETIGAPRILTGDSWSYQETTENKTGWHGNRIEIAVERAGPGGIAITAKEAGSTMPPREQLVEADWSRVRSVNGQQTLVNRPMAFPLTVGKSWVVEYAENNPNRLHAKETRKSVYKVTGWEDVTVPAGTFHALKIEADGDWSAVTAPAVSAVAGSRADAQGSTTVVQTGRTGSATFSGRTYKAYWYVPAVKRWVKSQEDIFDSNGARTERIGSELLSVQVGN